MGDTRTDWESINGSIAWLQIKIAMARQTGEIYDVLDVCDSLLDLVERLNNREQPR